MEEGRTEHWGHDLVAGDSTVPGILVGVVQCKVMSV